MKNKKTEEERHLEMLREELSEELNKKYINILKEQLKKYINTPENYHQHLEEIRNSDYEEEFYSRVKIPYYKHCMQNLMSTEEAIDALQRDPHNINYLKNNPNLNNNQDFQDQAKQILTTYIIRVLLTDEGKEINSLLSYIVSSREEFINQPYFKKSLLDFKNSTLDKIKNKKLNSYDLPKILKNDPDFMIEVINNNFADMQHVIEGLRNDLDFMTKAKVIFVNYVLHDSEKMNKNDDLFRDININQDEFVDQTIIRWAVLDGLKNKTYNIPEKLKMERYNIPEKLRNDLLFMRKAVDIDPLVTIYAGQEVRLDEQFMQHAKEKLIDLAAALAEKGELNQNFKAYTPKVLSDDTEFMSTIDTLIGKNDFPADTPE